MRLRWPHFGQVSTKPRSSGSIERPVIRRSFGTIRSFGFAQIVYYHFCRTEAFAIVPIASLESLENHMIGLRRVVARRDGFMILWVEWLPHAFFRFDTVSAQEAAELFQRQLHTLYELFPGSRLAASGFAVQDVYC